MTSIVSVLDHGFVILRNISGPTRRVVDRSEADGSTTEREYDADDVDPANTARMSFDMMDSGRTREADLKLANYLMKNMHTTPFEMIEVWLEMKLPISVARQLVRHRTVSINEVSGRYVQLPAEWYIPQVQDVVLQTKDKKQGGALVDMNDPEQVGIAQQYIDRLRDDCICSYRSYLASICDGIAMEQARYHLHVNHYTHWMWKQDLHNLMHMLSLRDHSHAQRESQAYAHVIVQLLRNHLPETMKLYDLYRRLE